MPPTVHTLRLELRVVPGGDDRATGASASTGTRAWAAHTPDGGRRVDALLHEAAANLGHRSP